MEATKQAPRTTANRGALIRNGLRRDYLKVVAPRGNFHNSTTDALCQGMPLIGMVGWQRAEYREHLRLLNVGEIIDEINSGTDLWKELHDFVIQFNDLKWQLEEAHRMLDERIGAGAGT